MAVATLLIGVWLLQVRRGRSARAARQRLFDPVLGMIDGRTSAATDGYPVLTGSHHGHPVRLEAVADSLTPRKLPILWLFVTQHRPLALDAPVDALARPIGTEFFSPNASFAHRLPTPPDFPVHARIATLRPTTLAPAALDIIGALMSDPKVKEVQIGPTGARIVYQLAEAAQGPYRTARQADFGAPRLESAELAVLLAGLAELSDALAADRARSR